MQEASRGAGPGVPARLTPSAVNAMPEALRILADQIKVPDNVPAARLRDAATMIETMSIATADAVRRPMGVVPDSATWLTNEELEAAEQRRPKKCIFFAWAEACCPGGQRHQESQSAP